MQIRDIPDDSILRRWCAYLSISEVPLSYQIAGGLCTLGCVLRRNRWIDQVDWRVHPNQSLMLIGPSGIGKDTAINRCAATVDEVVGASHVPTIGGATYENLTSRLASLPKPAAAFIPAPEITAFFGKADYQANMLTGMTNLLSNGKKVDITTKGDLFYTKGEGKFIYEPTLTMFAGSTVEWLHKGMPDGTLEGGFLGRFLIICEELGGKQIPLVKSGMSRQEVEEVQGELRCWNLGVRDMIAECKIPREMILFPEAEELYANWYYNRFKLFSKAVTPYANRSRDMVLRLAMLMALSRGHWRYIEGVDMQFAIDLIAEVAQRIDRVVLPPTVEAQAARDILSLLPAGRGEIYTSLGTKYPFRVLEEALKLLVTMEKVDVRADKKFVQKGEETW